MLIGLLYFLIIVIANTIGAISGMGGGVLIKPLLDLIHIHSVTEISFYASVAVLVMAIVSTGKQLRQGVEFEWLFVLEVSIGSVLGGFLGNRVFSLIMSGFPSGREVQLIQIGLTVITLIFSYVYTISDWENFELKRGWVKLLVGLVLGFLASLLGIGGGPINVAILMWLFNLPIKKATIYSIVTILFSQLSKVSSIVLSATIASLDLSMLIYIIPAGIVGGFVGAWLSRRIPSERVSVIYRGVILIVLLINLYNGWQIL